MVREGTVRREDQRGNNEADKAAELGATTASQAKVHVFGGIYSSRHQAYRAFMCRIQRYIVGLKTEERRLKQEAKRTRDPFDTGADNKVTVPKNLRYCSLRGDLPAEANSLASGPGEVNGQLCTDVVPMPLAADRRVHEGQPSNTTTISMHPMHNMWFESREEEEQVKKVQSFLNHLEWSSNEDPSGGITWIELYILYSIDRKSVV